VSESYPQLKEMSAFFASDEVLSQDVPHSQDFDFAGLSGRLRSSSYAPAPGQSGFPEMMDELKHIFTAYQRGGLVRFEYRTRIFVGNLPSTGIDV
jgi:hypothetical protein